MALNTSLIFEIIHFETMYIVGFMVFRQLTREQRMTKDATILFMVKDQDYFGMSSQFLGEAYYPFLEIPSTTMETNLQEMQQILLKLSKPTNFGKSIITLIVIE